MSENTHTQSQPDTESDHTAPPADATETVAGDAAAAGESTIGTGTSMALGCIAGTIVLIGFGLLFLFLSTLI